MQPSHPVAMLGASKTVEIGIAEDAKPIVDLSPLQNARPQEERRALNRRQQADARSPILPGVTGYRDRPTPQGWPLLLLAMALAVVSGLLVTHSAPPLISVIAMAVSLPLAAAISSAFDKAEPASTAQQIAAAGLTVVAPLFLFSLGLALWSIAGNLPEVVAFGALLSVAALATVYLLRHPMLIIAAQFAVWAAVVLVYQSASGGVVLALSLVASGLVARAQLGRQRAEIALSEARERDQQRVRNIVADYEGTRMGWFWETDRRTDLTYISAPIAGALGHKVEELLGMPLIEIFDLAGAGRESERTLIFHLNARSSFKEIAVRAAIEGEERWWSVSGRPIYDEAGNFAGFRGSGTDLTERMRSEKHAARLAHYDSLTGLANRFQMSQALEKILSAKRAENRRCCVMLLDLDRFKRVNDTMGHPAGDTLLKHVAQRLQSVVGQAGQVGRLGGDEFQFILPGELSRAATSELSNQIIASLSEPYQISGQSVVIGASIGIARAPMDGSTSEELIRNADLALYAAKDSGRGRHHYYTQALHAEAESRAQLERELRDAIKLGQLELFYQPVIATATEQIASFEALLRWRHPAKGWIPTDKFVSAAEDSGLISQIGEWAMRTACLDLAGWPAAVSVAVNVSALQFASPQLPAIVTSAVAQAGVDPRRLELEITESVFLNDSENTDAMFASLKGIGVRLALDDFGTGYSALGYLKRAPFDRIKIDRSFVRGATEDGSRNGAIIAAITSLAEALGMDTTAEGVETLDELDLVRLLGCSHVQGFIYEHPLSAADTIKRLQCGREAVAHGPRSSRASRQSMVRRVMLENGGERYSATIRNISRTGALVEGIWNIPQGTILSIRLSERASARGVVRWCHENRMGIEFMAPLDGDSIEHLLAADEWHQQSTSPAKRYIAG